MKKSLIAIAALAAAGAAAAQSSVTLYGVIDTGYGFQRIKSRLSTGTPTTSKRVNGVMSGNLSGSRWGLKGQEDLGNGLYAVFNVEAGFDSANGSFNDGGFNRRSVVGLKGSFGQVLIGRDYTPMDVIASDFQAIDAVTDDNVMGFYTPRAIGFHYSGDFSGVKVQAFAGQERTKISSSGAVISDRKEDGYGLGLGYANGPFAIQAAVQQFKTKETTPAPPTTTTNRRTEYGLGASYDFTAAKLMGHYIAKKPRGSKAIQQFGVGVDIPVGAATIGVQYAHNKADRLKGHDFGIQASYALSKRTDLYARALRHNAWKNKDSGYKTHTDTYVVGIRHRF